MTTMPIADFLRELEQAIEGLESGCLDPGTVFQELPQWDSLAVLATLAAVDSAFGVQLSADELRRCRTMQDLYDLARRKSA